MSILHNFIAAICVLCALALRCQAGMKVTGISLSSGLTSAEKKALLDEHNRQRTLQAEGKVPGHPSAADMTRLEWSDEVATHAQDWADRCPGLQHGNTKRFGDGQNIGLHSARDQIIEGSMYGWFNKEYPLYTYGSAWPGSAGHYTQIVTAYSYKLGCGANKCPGSTFGQLVCNFHVGGNMYGKPPFQRGPACSKCPAGYGFCKDSLCTSARVCSSSDPSCKCKVDTKKCATHGTFDSTNCQCRCEAGFTGLNCQEVCKDKPLKGCEQRKKDGWCKPSKSNKYYVDTVLSCHASCGFCQAAAKKPVSRPSGNQFTNWGSEPFSSGNNVQISVSKPSASNQGGNMGGNEGFNLGGFESVDNFGDGGDMGNLLDKFGGDDNW